MPDETPLPGMGAPLAPGPPASVHAPLEDDLLTLVLAAAGGAMVLAAAGDAVVLAAAAWAGRRVLRA